MTNFIELIKLFGVGGRSCRRDWLGLRYSSARKRKRRKKKRIFFVFFVAGNFFLLYFRSAAQAAIPPFYISINGHVLHRLHSGALSLSGIFP